MAAEKRASATSSLVSETASPAASAGKATAKPSSTVVAAPSLPKFSAVSNEGKGLTDRIQKEGNYCSALSDESTPFSQLVRLRFLSI